MSAFNIIQSMSNPPQTHRWTFAHRIHPLSALTNTTERRKHHTRVICACRWHWSKSLSCFTHELICLCFFFFFYNWNCSELLIDLSAHYNADLGQDEIKGCRQLPYSPAKASWLEGRLLWARFMLSNRTEMKREKNVIWDTVLYI